MEKMKPTQMVFVYGNNPHNGERVYKTESGLLCLANGAFVMRKNCVKESEYKAN